MRMLKLFLLLLSSIPILSLENDKYFFQLYPSEASDKPYLFHIINSESVKYTINSTDEHNMMVISQAKNDEIPMMHLSSIIKIDDKFLIKTGFGPNKLLEIIDENDESFIPKDDYFKNIKNNLENIKYCYSTAVKNPLSNGYLIVTYWTENTKIGGKETYEHKYILFDPNKKSYSNIYSLEVPKENNFYAQSCTNLRYEYIYCNIDPSFPVSKEYHFSINPAKFLSGSNKINLVQVLARFSNSIYHKPIGILRQTYTKSGKNADYFLTEYHDKSTNKTRLMSSLYINFYLTSLILRFDGLDIFYGINLEDNYIEPDLFNTILPNNDELIIIYIMKGAEGKYLLLLNRYDYKHSLQVQTKFDKYSLSNYLREDICEKPKYMQSLFVTSYIKYDDIIDKQIIKSSSENDYFKYQKDIGIALTCVDDNNKIFYQFKKISMPQCLNVLIQMNEKNDLFSFKDDKDVIILDIKNNPNLKSLRNVEIQFIDSNIYNRIMTVSAKKGSNIISIERNTILNGIDQIEFKRTNNFKKGKTYQIPYKIKQTQFSEVSIECHLSSDLCYFEFNYEGEIEDDCTVEYCQECENKICIECDENIIGIKLNKTKNECACDVNNGFKKEPNININMCVCQEGYSFYQNINKCLPDLTLNSGSYCIIGQDERSLINIYDDVPNGMKKYYENGLPYCKTPEIDECETKNWFKMGNYIFNSAKIGNCVYIIYNNEIVIYSNRSECGYIYYDYKNCLDIDIKTEEDYNRKLDKAYEYISDNNDNTYFNIKIDNNTFFYILNDYTSELYSSVQLSDECIEKVKEENGLSSLLIFVANIKKENEVSTQVEYNFYNSEPKYMNQKLDMSSCFPKEINEDNNTKINNETKRHLQIYFGNFTYNNSYPIKIDEIIVKVKIDWTEENMQIIDELYNKRGINIFDSSDDFYNDVCNKYTTPAKTDMYLQDRRDKYYINEAFCEKGCVQIGYESSTERVICKCKIKEDPDNYENVTFVPNELDDHFKKKYILPNIRVVKCFIKLKWSNNAGFYVSLFLFIAFTILCIVRYLDKIDFNEEKEETEKNKRNLLESDNENNEIKDSARRETENEENKEKNKKKIFRWEEPLEFLKKKIYRNEDDNKDNKDNNNTKKDKDDNKIEENNNDPDAYNYFRTPPKEENSGKIKKYSRINNNKNLGQMNRMIYSGSSNIINTEKITIKNNKKTKKSEESSTDKISNDDNISKIDNNKNEKKDDKKNEKTSTEDGGSNHNNELISETDKNTTSKEQKKLVKLLETIDNKNNLKESLNSSGCVPKNQNRNYYDYDDKLSNNQDNKDDSKKDNSNKDNSKKDDFEFKNDLPKEINEEQPSNQKKKEKEKEKENTIESSIRRKDPYDQQSERGSLKKTINNDQEDEVKKNDFNELFKNLVYLYKRNTQTPKDVNEFKEKNKGFLGFIKLFSGKYVCHSTLFFILPWNLCTKNDADGYFIKLAVLIIYIAFYMSFNILTEFNLSTLHLYIHKFNDESSSGFDKFINMFLPFIVLYVPIAWVKKSLSLTLFCLEESDKIDFIKNNKKYINNRKTVLFKGEETRVKKFRNRIETNTRLIIFYGLILLFFNWYLATSFCGIYHNSFLCVIVNMLCSIGYTKAFSFGLHLLSTLFKYFKCFSFKLCFCISERFNCKKLIDCTYGLVCRFSYFLCFECWKEEFDDEDDTNKDEDEKNDFKTYK